MRSRGKRRYNPILYKYSKVNYIKFINLGRMVKTGKINSSLTKDVTNRYVFQNQCKILTYPKVLTSDLLCVFIVF